MASDSATHLATQQSIKAYVDAEVAAKLKKSLDLSQRDTKKMLNILRKGNVKVESNVNEILEEIGKELVKKIVLR